jgi:hypothetical protein
LGQILRGKQGRAFRFVYLDRMASSLGIPSSEIYFKLARVAAEMEAQVALKEGGGGAMQLDESDAYLAPDEVLPHLPKQPKRAARKSKA